MAKYRLIGGNWNHYGKVYKRGDIVECPFDPRTNWPACFEKVTQEGPIQVSKPTVAAGANVPVRHSPEPQDPAEAPPAPPAASLPRATQVRPKGKNVTAKFPRAVDEDYLVFQDDTQFYVYDIDEPAKSLNDKGLKRGEVVKFIQERLEV
jgi:hypothetical protein